MPVAGVGARWARRACGRVSGWWWRVWGREGWDWAMVTSICPRCAAAAARAVVIGLGVGQARVALHVQAYPAAYPTAQHRQQQHSTAQHVHVHMFPHAAAGWCGLIGQGKSRSWGDPLAVKAERARRVSRLLSARPPPHPQRALFVHRLVELVGKGVPAGPRPAAGPPPDGRGRPGTARVWSVTRGTLNMFRVRAQSGVGGGGCGGQAMAPVGMPGKEPMQRQAGPSAAYDNSRQLPPPACAAPPGSSQQASHSQPPPPSPLA